MLHAVGGPYPVFVHYPQAAGVGTDPLLLYVVEHVDEQGTVHLVGQANRSVALRTNKELFNSHSSTTSLLSRSNTSQSYIILMFINILVYDLCKEYALCNQAHIDVFCIHAGAGLQQDVSRIYVSCQHGTVQRSVPVHLVHRTH